MVHLSLRGCSCSNAIYRSRTSACSITQGSPSIDFISLIRPRTRRITPGPHDANLVTLNMSALVLLETTVVRVSFADFLQAASLRRRGTVDVILRSHVELLKRDEKTMKVLVCAG